MFDLAVRGIVTAPGTVPGADWLAIGGSAVRAVGWGAAAVAVPAFFPDGHLPGPRWRWLGWTLAGSLVATFFGVALDPHAQNFELQAAGWHSPLHLPGAAASLANLLGTLSLPLMAATVVGSVTGMVSRWRRGSTALRRQLLTFAIAAALPVIVIPTAFGSGWPTWLFAASTLPLPIAIAAAILTGGVFDLATVANRSLVWGALAASIVAIYALIIMGVGVMLDATDARWLPWLGTAVVAVSFAPLRTALAQAADRVTYGQWRAALRGPRGPEPAHRRRLHAPICCSPTSSRNCTTRSGSARPRSATPPERSWRARWRPTGTAIPTRWSR